MGRLAIRPTGIERPFADDEIIVSKTDTHGRITYANDVFLRVSGYEYAELIGAPQSIIRHPDMPRAVFQLLWDEIRAGREMFAYIVNLASDGGHYWVFAHVTPTFASDGRTIVGYHSNRRTADRRALRSVQALYAQLRAVEAGQPGKREAVAASMRTLTNRLAEGGQSYDQFVWSL